MSDPDHPHQQHPPHSDPQTSSSAPQAGGSGGTAPRLATRGERFVGRLIDIIILAVVMMPLYFIIGLATGLGDAPDTTFAFRVAIVVMYVIVFLVIQGYLLASRGQTVGKLLIKTRIVDRNTEQLVAFGPLILKRYAWLWLCALIPYLGAIIILVDVLVIFRPTRACLHDDIAHTKVIKAL